MSEEYKEYVRKITPTYQLWKQMVKAFFVGRTDLRTGTACYECGNTGAWYG